MSSTDNGAAPPAVAEDAAPPAQPPAQQPSPMAQVSSVQILRASQSFSIIQNNFPERCTKRIS